MSKQSTKASALLSLIQKVPTETSAVPDGSAVAPTAKPLLTRRDRPSKTAAQPLSKTPTVAPGGIGKRTQVFLHDGDRKLIRELVAYFAGQGRRVSESLVIKAALRTAKPGEELLRAYQQAAAQDQRFKEHSA